MAVILISPTSTEFSLPVTFEWNSDDGSYCWDNYIDVFDQSGTLIDFSGSFNPNGGNSVFSMFSVPDGVTSIQYNISCNPNNVLAGSLAAPVINQDGDDEDQAPPADSGDESTPVIEVAFPESIALEFDSGLSASDRSDLIGAALIPIAIAFGFALVLKIIK